MERLLHDLRLGLRTLRKNPAFAAAAIAALTLGIGVNTAIFSVVNTVLLRPVALPEPDRLVYFMNVTPNGSGPGASPAKFNHWRDQSSVIEDAAAFNTGIMNYTGGSFPEQWRSGRVSQTFFKLIGAKFERGHGFMPEQDVPRGPKTVVLSYNIWQTRFNSDPDILGKSVSLSAEPYEVIGVLSRDVSLRDFGQDPDVWVAFQIDPNSTDQGNYFSSMARLKPGVSIEQAQAAIQGSTEVFRAKYPNAIQPQVTFSVMPVRDVLVRNVRQSLVVIAWAVSLVLLIACANVANLLLARSSGRGREIAVRAALGGSRPRIVRQLLTESVLLASIGGVLGLGLGFLGIRALLSVNTAGLPRIGVDGANVGIDWRVALFTAGIALGTGILFGLLPALQASRVDLTTSLKESSGRSGTGARQRWTRGALVVSEVALAMILVIGSALLIKSAVALSRVDPGFDATNVLTMRMSLTGPQFQQAAGVEQMVRNGVDQLAALPFVELATATCCVPLQGGYGLPFRVSGRPLNNGPFHGGAGWMTVSSGYFEAFRIPVRRGRTFTRNDDAGALPVVVVNEAFVRQYFQGEEPMAQHLTIGKGGMREFAAEPEREIIGIVGDSHDAGLNASPQPIMFIPQPQVPDAANALNVGLTPMAWVVRTKSDPGPFTRQIQERLQQATGLPVSQIQSMNDVVSVSTSRSRFNMWIMSVFGGAALLLAAIGIYGLMAYSVAQRRQEIGIRLALGAQLSTVRRMVIVQGMALAIVGAAVGIAASLWLARFMTGFLFQTGERDPLIFSITPVVLLVVALAAVWLPALRASRVDPVKALRAE
ncbi:MAG TPA: ABC transporter permease [Vicinamibacterales bacterium]|nr:ABC transporter permease [Vicinamibacterales bacterium]